MGRTIYLLYFFGIYQITQLNAPSGLLYIKMLFILLIVGVIVINEIVLARRRQKKREEERPEMLKGGEQE